MILDEFQRWVWYINNNGAELLNVVVPAIVILYLIRGALR
jgi:hypothetical protein